MVLSIELTNANAYEHVLAFAALYEAGECCDAQVIIDGEVHPVSRMALGAASTFFKAAFSHELREGRTRSVTIDPNLNATCARQLVRFAHTATLTIEESMVETCIQAADQLGFEAIVPRLLKGLETGLECSNCVARYVIARRFENDALISATTSMFLKSIAECAAAPAFLALSLDQVAHVFSDNMGGTTDIVACTSVSEVSIYEACMAWFANRCPAERTNETLGRLMSIVHLPMLGADYLCRKVMYSEAILGSPAARHLVEKAVHYLAAPSARAELVSMQMLPRAMQFYGEHSLAFDERNLPQNVLVVNDGQRLERKGSSWRGARAREECGDNEKWRFRISGVGPQAAQVEYFLGLAQRHVPLDISDDDPAGVVGISFRNAHVGDEITFVTDGQAQKLHYWISLNDGRTELDWMDNLVGELDWEDQWREEWFPFVQVKGGSEAEPAAIDIVGYPHLQSELPEVEW